MAAFTLEPLQCLAWGLVYTGCPTEVEGVNKLQASLFQRDQNKTPANLGFESQLCQCLHCDLRQVIYCPQAQVRLWIVGAVVKPHRPDHTIPGA